VQLSDLEAGWRVWTLLEATGWRWPPSVLLEQPDALLADVLTIAAVAQRMKAQEIK
jgi:hypothetical protein